MVKKKPRSYRPVINFNTIFTGICGVVIVLIQTCNHQATVNTIQSNADASKVAQKQEHKSILDSLSVHMDSMLVRNERYHHH